MLKITNNFLNPIISESMELSRRRKNFNFHKSDSDLMQRMINVFNTYSYIQPHRHLHPPKREVFLILKGSLLVLEFSDLGSITDWTVLNTNTGNFAVEILSGTWHTVYALENETVVYELKDGPYNATTDKQFALWAPAENDEAAISYVKNLVLTVIPDYKF